MKLSVIKKPVVSEKSLMLANTQNAYTFEVDRHATKDQIKQAITDAYGVTILKVTTITSNPDTKKTGRKRLSARVAPVKKAVVSLKEGNTIEAFDVYNK